ncbi:sialidase-like [Pseudophryne corroboree]|uniref:sialidase-like n=1 Tax=Pseudophryne corroboree TaxID=495146 RepID=UPI003081FC9F
MNFCLPTSESATSSVPLQEGSLEHPDSVYTESSVNGPSPVPAVGPKSPLVPASLSGSNDGLPPSVPADSRILGANPVLSVSPRTPPVPTASSSSGPNPVPSVCPDQPPLVPASPSSSVSNAELPPSVPADSSILGSNPALSVSPRTPSVPADSSLFVSNPVLSVSPKTPAVPAGSSLSGPNPVPSVCPDQPPSVQVKSSSPVQIPDPSICLKLPSVPADSSSSEPGVVLSGVSSKQLLSLCPESTVLADIAVASIQMEALSISPQDEASSIRSTSAQNSRQSIQEMTSSLHPRAFQVDSTPASECLFQSSTLKCPPDTKAPVYFDGDYDQFRAVASQYLAFTESEPSVTISPANAIRYFLLFFKGRALDWANPLIECKDPLLSDLPAFCEAVKQEFAPKFMQSKSSGHSGQFVNSLSTAKSSPTSLSVQDQDTLDQAIKNFQAAKSRQRSQTLDLKVAYTSVPPSYSNTSESIDSPDSTSAQSSDQSSSSQFFDSTPSKHEQVLLNQRIRDFKNYRNWRAPEPVQSTIC